MGTSFSSAGRQFRQSLTKRDVRDIILARNSFHISTFLPLLLYHLRVSEPRPKFPATISHSIRKGIPKVAANLFWLVGWTVMISVFLRRSGRLGRYFVIQMFLTGVVTTIVCPLGKGELSDKIHFVTAGLYMVDHHLLFDFLNTSLSYRFGFYSSFLLFAASIMRQKKLHEVAKVATAESIQWSSQDDYQRELARADLTPAQRRELRILDFAIMAFEYGLFISFVSGMGTGLPPPAAAPAP